MRVAALIACVLVTFLATDLITLANADRLSAGSLPPQKQPKSPPLETDELNPLLMPCKHDTRSLH